MKRKTKNLEQKYRIRRLLEERGWTPASAAREMGVSPGTLANNIAGYRSQLEMQKKLAAFLDVPVAELFDGNGAGHGAIGSHQEEKKSVRK